MCLGEIKGAIFWEIKSNFNGAQSTKLFARERKLKATKLRERRNGATRKNLKLRKSRGVETWASFKIQSWESYDPIWSLIFKIQTLTTCQQRTHLWYISRLNIFFTPFAPLTTFLPLLEDFTMKRHKSFEFFIFLYMKSWEEDDRGPDKWIYIVSALKGILVFVSEWSSVAFF